MHDALKGFPTASAWRDDLLDHWKAHWEGALDEQETDEHITVEGRFALGVWVQYDEDREGAERFVLRFDNSLETPIARGDLDDIAEDPRSDAAEIECYVLAVALLSECRVWAMKRGMYLS